MLWKNGLNLYIFLTKEMIHSHENTLTKSNELQNCFCMAPCDYAESNLNLLFYSKYLRNQIKVFEKNLILLLIRSS